MTEPTPQQVELLREALWHLDRALEAIPESAHLDEVHSARDELSFAISHLEPEEDA